MVNVIALCSFDHYGLRWRGEIFAVSAQTAADLAQAGLVAVYEPPPEQVQTEQVQTEQTAAPKPSKGKNHGKADTAGKGQAASAGGQ